MAFHRSCICLAPLLIAALLIAGSAAATRADEGDDQFAVAAGHYAQKRWPLAVAEFQTFLKEFPRHPQADQSVFFLAEAQLQTGRSEEAGSHFRQYLNRQPDGKFVRPALFRSGEAAYLAGKSDLAKADLTRFRSTYPQDKLNAYVLPYLGDVALGQGDVKAAVRHFRAGLSEFPQGRLLEDCRFGLARALERQGHSEQAEALYQAVAAKPRHPLADDARCHLGILQYSAGKHAEAIATFAAFETTLADSPWQSNARLGHGWALRNLGRLEDAKAMFEKITADAKVGVEAWYWLGVVQRTEEDWIAAAASMKAAAEAAGPAHRRIHDIYFHAGDCLLRAGKPAEAVEQFNRVTASGADGNEWIDDALYGKLQAALELKQYEDVDRVAAEFERRFPQGSLKSDVHRVLARSLLQQKRHAEAVKLIEPLVALKILDRQGMQDRYLLALAFQAVKRYEDALAVLLPVLDSATPSESMKYGQLRSDALLVQGSLLVAMQKYTEAAEPLEAFLAAKPTGDGAAKPRGELAICYARTQRFDRAKTVYAELLERHPGHPVILPTIEQLAEAAYDAEDADWASKLFERLRSESGSAEYLWKGLSGLAWSQLKAGELAESAATFQELLDADPPAEMAAEAALARGNILQRLGRSDAAIAMYDLVVDGHPQTPQHPQAMLAAARLRDALQQDQESAALYQRLAKQYADGAEMDAVLYEWAWVLDELGKIDESSGLFERLRQEHPQSRYRADATYRLARRTYVAGDYARANELVLEVLAGKPDEKLQEDTLDLRGHLAVASHDWEHVEEAFGDLIGQFPESPKRLVAEYYIAEAAYMRKDYDEAARQFDRLARQIPGRQEAWLAIVPLRHAQALAHLKRWHEASEVAAKIEAAYPNFAQQFEADYLIGRCLAAEADLQGARDAYAKVIRSPTGAKTETAAMAQLMIAETYWHQKNFTAALQEYLRVEILYAYPTWQALALLQAGKCHQQLGQWQQAAELYARLLKVYPNEDAAKEASQRLKTPPKMLSEAGQPE